ncbi:hypothetical protein [Citrobacter werkmanii]|uniref:hypothetical protein n=1 Tax=Citrobacter werkmanii TaxID=67827 RepID=UPI0034D753CB
MIVDDSLEVDPFSPDSVIGWGVLKCAPWDLVGVFETELRARDFAVNLGADYEVVFGTYKPGTNNFLVWVGE